MNILYLLILLIITGSSIINSIKWGRFAQREHYLPGSVTRFYFRWVRTTFINKFLFFISLILFVISLWLYFVPIFVIILTLFTPLGISFKTRTGDINITERLQRVNYLYYLVIVLISLVSYFTGYGYIFALLANMFSFFIYDQCLKILQSYEKNISKVFVNDASIKLNSISLPVVGITGSYSKTTTKNVLKQILEQKNNTFATPESYNNRLGIAKAINENFNKDHDIALIEMGTYANGEIREICSWVRPHIAVITGIAPVHLERMKTLENILDAKSEIVELAGSVVINGDDELLLNEARLWTNQKQVYDCSTTSNEAAVYVEYENDKHDIYIGGEFVSSVKGPKLLQLSISLSVGVLLALDLNIDEYFTNLKSLDKTEHRQNIIKSDYGHSIIDNSFNSNPMAIDFSLATLSQLGNEKSKRYLITPGLIELGSDQFSINYAFANEASIVVDEAIIVGYTNKRSLISGFEDNNIPCNWYPNRDEAVAFLNSIVESDDIVLFENDLPDHYP
ncbi:MAG: hypothetical protein CL508_02230 [Actinobacteria bacterium]|jgi:UDP-N-acetylmuramoyl-tripeptide--D-alanyl-D-alanine ligase|nr:hypothetical protein [Actinomycetota bacterium]|tara:strand:- start:313 stop:1839 length:1527 start_codon:yes stop_codon:yes gene_type:complete